MKQHLVPHNLLVYATSASHAAMIAGAIALYATGRIDSTAFAAILATFGAAWSGVAGALITVRRSRPSTVVDTGAPAPGATAAPTTYTPPKQPV